MAESDHEGDDGDKTLKIVVCGDGSSGKTSICSRFSHDVFERQYQQVWDIGGQSIASEMLEKYVFGAHGALVVYDITNPASFENVHDWVNVIRRITNRQEKTDQEQRRAIRIDKHKKLAEELGMTSHYVSAKSGDSVTLLFRQAAADILGIALGKAEVEADIVIVEGEVARADPVVVRKPPDQSRNTAVCSLM